MNTEGPPVWRALDALGLRSQRRPTPRLTIAIAAAGVALAVVGALVISGNELGGNLGEETGGSPNRVPGVVLCGAVIAAGYVVLSRYRTGPLGAAGVGATVLALPPLLFFVTFDATPTSLGGVFNLNAVLLISIVVWLGSYLVGPSRGHSAYLGSAVVAAWVFVLNQVEELLTIPDRVFTSFFEGIFGTESIPVDPVDWTTLGLVSLVIAVGYLVVSRLLDRRGLHGTATPLVFGGLLALTTGLLFLADELGQGGFGLFVLIAGLLIGAFGATANRRFSTWYGGFGVFFGASSITEDIVSEPVPGGYTLIGVGIGFVVVAYLIADRWKEPDELDPGPSTFAVSFVAGRPSPPSPPSPASPPPAAQPWQPPPAPPLPPSPPVQPP